MWQGPHHSAQKSTRDRQVRPQDLPLEILIGHGDDVGAHRSILLGFT
jgi:hypothetical protein